MNILILIRRFDFGGAENHVRDMANALSDNGHKIFLFSKRGRQAQLLSAKIRFHAAHLSKWTLPINFIFLFIFALKKKIDIIHAHQPSAILTASFLGKFSKIPVIVTIHSTTSLELSNFTQKIPSRILFVSRFTMERSPFYSLIKTKSRYIPNAILPSGQIFSGMQKTIVTCNRIEKSNSRFLSILLKDVMPQLKIEFPDIKLQIIGDGRFLKRVKKWADNVNNQWGADTVSIIGYQERFATDASLVIGVGRVALEALSFGIPVLSANAQRCGPLVSCKNYKILSQNNFVDVTAKSVNAKIVVESIAQIVRNYQSSLESRRLQEMVNRDFSLLDFVKKIEHVYQEVINEKSG